MLMTAGLGTRLRPFTESIPKPLLPVMGIPLIELLMHSLCARGIKNSVANIHPHPEFAERGLRAAAKKVGTPLIVSSERDILLGSAGGMRRAITHLSSEGRFFYINGDVLSDFDLDALARAHTELNHTHGVWMTLGLLNAPKNGQYRQIFTESKPGLSQGRITALGEVVPGKRFFGGVAVIEAQMIEALNSEGPSDFVNDLLRPAVTAGCAGFYDFGVDPLWIDVGSPELWHHAHLEVMTRVENGSLPEIWGDRINEQNLQIGPGQWIHRDFKKFKKEYLNQDGHFYWGPGSPVTHRLKIKSGAKSIWYGDAPKNPVGNGIGWNLNGREEWVELTSAIQE